MIEQEERLVKNVSCGREMIIRPNPWKIRTNWIRTNFQISEAIRSSTKGTVPNQVIYVHPLTKQVRLNTAPNAIPSGAWWDLFNRLTHDRSSSVNLSVQDARKW